MGRPKKEDRDLLNQIRGDRGRTRLTYKSPEIPSRVKEAGETYLRYLDRGTRLAGLGLGTLAGATVEGLARHVPAARDWLPDISELPDAIRAFDEFRKQGDWDSAISAYQDELDAGKYFWGLSEIAGAFVPTGAPAIVGRGAISAAPAIARAVSRVAPAVAKEATEAGVGYGVKGIGYGLRVPWEAEEALGRGLIGAAKWAGRGAARGGRFISEGTAPRPPDESVSDVVRSLAEAVQEGGPTAAPVDFILPTRIRESILKVRRAVEEGVETYRTQGPRPVEYRGIPAREIPSEWRAGLDPQLESMGMNRVLPTEDMYISDVQLEMAMEARFDDVARMQQEMLDRGVKVPNNLGDFEKTQVFGEIEAIRYRVTGGRESVLAFDAIARRHGGKSIATEFDILSDAPVSEVGERLDLNRLAADWDTMGQPETGIQASRDAARVMEEADDLLYGPTAAPIVERNILPSVEEATTGMVRLYHGSPNTFEAFDVGRANPDALYGPGIYLTADPGIASGYARKRPPNPFIPSRVPDSIARAFRERYPEDYPPVWQVVFDWDRNKVNNARAMGEPLRPDLHGERFIAISSGGYGEKAEAIGLEFVRGKGFSSLYRLPGSSLSFEAAPNIQPVVIQLNKVLDIDAPADKELLESLQRDWADYIDDPPYWAAEASESSFNLLEGKISNPTNKQVYRMIVEFSDPSFAKAEANDLLSSDGYDGITHIGGGITGNPAHRVVIAIGDEFTNLENSIKAAPSRLPGEVTPPITPDIPTPTAAPVARVAEGVTPPTIPPVTPVARAGVTPIASDAMIEEAKKFKTAESFVESMYAPLSYDMTPGVTRLPQQKTTGKFHGTNAEAVQGILSEGKIEARVTKLDRAGQKSVSVSGNRATAGSYGTIVFELDPKLRVYEPSAGVVRGDYYKGFELRHPRDIPLSSVRAAFIDIGRSEGLETRVITGWKRPGEPIYSTIGQVQRQLEGKGIKTYVANFADKDGLAAIWNRANPTAAPVARTAARERLQNSPVRQIGLLRSNEATAEAYLNDLRDQVEQYLPERLPIIDEAIGMYHQGDFGNAQAMMEQSLQHLHFDELAEIRHIESLQRAVEIDIPSELLPPTPPPVTPVRGGITPPGGEPPTTPPGGARPGEEPPSTTLWQVQDMGEAIETATRTNFGRKVANIWGISHIQSRLNPSAVRNTVEGKALTGRNILLFQASQKASHLMSRVWEIGTQEQVLGKANKQGRIIEGPLEGLAPNDVRSYPDDPRWKDKVTPKMREWINQLNELEDEKLKFLTEIGVDVKLLKFEEGGHYGGRMVSGKTDSAGNIDFKYTRTPSRGRKGFKLPMEQERTIESQEEAIRLGFSYFTEDETLYLNILGALNKATEKKFANWIIDNSPSIRRLTRGQRPRKAGRDILAEQEIDIGEFGKSFERTVFTGPESHKVKELLIAELKQEVHNILRYGAMANAVGRFMVLNGDASQFLIQMLYMTGTRGGYKAWGKGLNGYVNALFDPNYHASLLRNNEELLHLHRDMITSLKGSEYTEAVEKGGLLSLGKWWNPYKVLTPFARGFNASMDDAGIQLAKSLDAALRPKTAAEYADIDAFINEIRGLASSQRLGVSATTRALENNLLLAPRYNRAIAALLWDTVADGGIRGNEARWALLRSVSGLMLIGSAFSMAQYYRNTDEKDQTFEGLEKAVLDHINPRSDRFFTWKVGDTNMGPGTKVRSLIKLVGDTTGDPDSMFEFSQRNPFIQFSRGNLAPVGSIAWDMFSGYNYMGDPTGFRDGWTEDDLGESFKKLGENVLLDEIMPIWVNSVLLEGGTPLDRATRGAVEFIGGRAYPEGVLQIRDELSQELFNAPYETLNADVKQIVDATMVERHGEQEFWGEQGPIRKEISDVKTRFLEGVQKLADERLSAPPGSERFNPELARKGTENFLGLNELQEARMTELFGTWKRELQRREGGLYEDIYDMDEELEEPEIGTRKHRLWQYYQVFENSKTAAGKMDWDEFDIEMAKFWAGLRVGEAEEILANIQTIEGEYPEEVSRMVNAGRYASSLEVPILGEDVTYYDLEKHPSVVRQLATGARVTEDRVMEFLDLSFAERDSHKTAETELGKIGKSLDKATRTNGILWMMRNHFVENAPDEWIIAMFDAGYKYQNYERINTALKRQIRSGRYKPNLEYRNLYLQNLSPYW